MMLCRALCSISKFGVRFPDAEYMSKSFFSITTPILGGGHPLKAFSIAS
ncbi:hypothetical protein JYU34_015031 [Plutella xylostella]|uniref:Uncharacterized protein n=1 Tax=Plutella xylostella TaxID=51655 RepID=A0ABQ7Q696_PLUXY|nr:hypothetical protein JYU34_015031 [Plutella xylostella]